MQDKKKMISEGMRRQEKKMENGIGHEANDGFEDGCRPGREDERALSGRLAEEAPSGGPRPPAEKNAQQKGT
jgi:hypothetical protein